MLLVMAIVLGSLVGAGVMDSPEGALLGAYLGGLTQRLLTYQRKVTSLTDEVTTLNRHLNRLRQDLHRRDSAPMPDTSTEALAKADDLSAPADKTIPDSLEPLPEVPFAANAPEMPISAYQTSSETSASDLKGHRSITESVTGDPNEPGEARALDSNNEVDENEKAPSPSAWEADARVQIPQWEKGWLDSWIDKGKQWVIDYFTGGNLFVRVGLLVLFFGVAFLLKYAAQTIDVPVELRYVAVLLGATAMLILGWRVRQSKPSYGLAIQGGAIGLLYLVIFAAFRIHHLMNAGLCFSLLTGVVLMGVGIALLQDAMILAAIAVAGGFASPLLASTGTGSHVELFGYYLVLNLGILAVSWFKAWRVLNWLGFMFTFGIGMSWGYRFYAPEYFNSTEPFLIAFFILYTLIPVLFALRQPPQLKGLIDGSLVFGTPTLVIGLQAALVGDMPNILAWSAAWMGGWYLLLVILLRRITVMQMLNESFLALAVAFLTLAIPLGFEGRVTSAVWAVEGLALLWVGLRQSRLLPRLSGTGLMLVSGVFYISDQSSGADSLFLLNNDFIGCLLIALAGWGGYTLLYRYAEQTALWMFERRYLGKAMLIWGTLWWLVGGWLDIDEHFHGNVERFIGVTFLNLTALVAWWCAGKQRDPVFSALGLLAHISGIPVLILCGYAASQAWPWFNMFYLASLLQVGCGISLCLWSIRDQHADFVPYALPGLTAVFWLAVGAFLFVTLQETELHYSGAYEVTLYLVALSLFLLILVGAHRRVSWPVLSQPMLLALPALAFSVFYFVDHNRYFSEGAGWLIFPSVLLGHIALLRWLERYPQYPLGYLHLGTVLLVLWAVTWQMATLVASQPLLSEQGMALATWGALPALLLWRQSQWQAWHWPVQRYAWPLASLLPLILGVSLALWMVWANTQVTGTSAQFYLPVFNPVDLVSLAVIALLWRLGKTTDLNFGQNLLVLRWAVAAVLGFFWINMALFKGFYYLDEIPFTPHAQLGSIKVQSGLSLLWSLLGTLAMLLGARRYGRSVWIAGACLLGATVLKLFVTDLSGTGTVARIIAFLGVGLVLLLVGFFAPVPPAREDKTADKAAEV
ncbi:MAG: DUF2339 domain-containing protein [Hahellaceae bacterium]|nr:DUF2339 domain-containing protein [Hahellaceae bacterium]MCP5168971.1 DUF2339 domain-containing protein [Hahellaceae bacterium]